MGEGRVLRSSSADERAGTTIGGSIDQDGTEIEAFPRTRTAAAQGAAAPMHKWTIARPQQTGARPRICTHCAQPSGSNRFRLH